MPQKKTEDKDLLTRLRDAGEDALQKVAELPGGKRMLDAMNGLRDRVDELQQRMKRVDELEKRVEALEKAAKKPAPRRRTSTSRTSGSSTKKT
jgi:hypothetical protein